ncbi:MAG: Ig-like domain-containing protein [Thermoplasmata archaeon]|nr:MAG: Ig-like domain-containing protein [Thermoplasmata archaeon]
MCGRKVRRVFRWFIGVLLILSLFQVIPFDEPLVKNASASSSWMQTTAQDFNNGTLTDLNVTSTGELKLNLQANYIKDDFFDCYYIEEKLNLDINTILGEIKLKKINQTFGGVDEDVGYSINQTSDGGYIITGYTLSYGGYDVWLIKTNSTGDEEWNTTFGGGWDEDEGRSVQETSDGGFIITGVTYSISPDGDVWLIKTNDTGVEEWSNNYGGSLGDVGNSVQQTPDGGYIIAGQTASWGAGNNDAWLIKTDSGGDLKWNRTFGGSFGDVGQEVQVTSDKGYIITGSTSSWGAGKADAWVIKVSGLGSEVWNKTLGGEGSDYGYSVQETSDGGYIMTGYTNSFGANNYNAWLIKTDSSGNELWNESFGGSDDDRGYSVQETSDGGFIVTGKTNSYSVGSSDLWLIKINSSGIEQWNRTFGGSLGDNGQEVRETSDGGFIITGGTSSYGAGGSDVWLIKTNDTGYVPFYYGELTSRNLIVDEEANLINNFTCNTSIPSKTKIKVQFSQNNINWYNSSGSENEWDLLNDGMNLINLSSLSWLGSHFYYKLNFTSDTIDAPSVHGINVSFTKYLSEGNLISQVFDAGNGVNWTTISWTGAEPTNTSIKFQLKSQSSGGDFLGPDGTPASYYEIPGTDILFVHDSDQWIQYKVYLETTDTSYTPVLEEITIFYNYIPLEPQLLSPADDTLTNNSKPVFTWNFFDTDSTHGGFQVLIDDDSGFGSVNYNSGERTSGTPSYTPILPIADGNWYWKVRTKDSDGDWGPYSIYWNITIDATPPVSFTPTADPSGWTSNTQPVITFSTTDVTTGVNRYEVKIDSGGFSTQTSPYTIPSQTDGVHNITVRAYDEAANYYESYVDVYIDTTPSSITHTPVISGIIGVPINITAEVVDDDSGIQDVFLYIKKPIETTYTQQQMSADGNTYFVEIPGTAITTDGLEYYIKAVDNADSPNIIYYGAFGPIDIEPISSNDIDITVADDTSLPVITHTPVTSGTSGTPIIISAGVTDDGSGVEYAFLYYKKSSDPSYTEQQMTANGNTYSGEIPGSAVTLDGIDYYIKAVDKANNIAYYGGSGQTDTQPVPSTDIGITITEDDTWPPTILDYSPEGSDVPIDTTITIVFSEEMNRTSVEDSFSISPTTSGVFSWQGISVLTFTPSSPLSVGTIYELSISRNATDLAGNNMTREYNWQFITTTQANGITHPNVVDLSWSPIGTDVKVSTTIEVSFSEEMIKGETEQAFSITPSVKGVFTWRGHTLEFTPSSPLAYETLYNVSISTRAKNLDGIGLERNHTWSFITEKAPEEKGLFSWENLEPIVTGLTVLASIIIFLIGFLTIRKKRSKLRQYIERIDDTFNKYKKDPQECEQELIALREDIKAEVKEGKLEENHFLILDKKIDDYLMEMKALEKEEAGAVLEADITEPVSEDEDIGGGFE